MDQGLPSGKIQYIIFPCSHKPGPAIWPAQTRALGLSLGDRACLALGLALKAPVYTADKSWKKLKVRRSHPRHPLRVIVSAGRDGIPTERMRVPVDEVAQNL